jgi:hypothetical protein
VVFGVHLSARAAFRLDPDKSGQSTPTVSFLHYHKPSDELSKINREKMTNIIRLGFLNTWEFANSNQYLQKEIK